MTYKAYSGIGSRRTPDHILKWMVDIGRLLAKKGFILRSGAADGADSAFERGCDEVKGAKEIYIPWASFNGHPSQLFGITSVAFELAEKLHPNWAACSEQAKALHARNVCQVLGVGLDSPVRFVVCWTPRGEEVGGTATAMRLARERGVPVINLFNDDWNRRLVAEVDRASAG